MPGIVYLACLLACRCFRTQNLFYVHAHQAEVVSCSVDNSKVLLS